MALTTYTRCCSWRQTRLRTQSRPCLTNRRTTMRPAGARARTSKTGRLLLGGGFRVRSSPDTEEARSPVDAPQEWEAPAPSRRPDIFPEFEKLDRTAPDLPKPLPGDPEMPDEEEEESKKRTNPGDPDPERRQGDPDEDEPEPGEPGTEPEKEPNIPVIPE